jgi:hypothetical protein
MTKILWHVWRHGHSVRVNRGITVAMNDSSKGWLYVCECGWTVAR